MEDTTNGGALRSIFGLGAKQKLQVIKMVEDKVEKSENRVLAAIVGLRSEIGVVKDSMKDVELSMKDVELSMKDVELNVGRRLSVHMWSTISWVTVMFFGQVGFLTWLFFRLTTKT